MFSNEIANTKRVKAAKVVLLNLRTPESQLRVDLLPFRMGNEKIHSTSMKLPVAYCADFDSSDLINWPVRTSSLEPS
jgi:hypothetical protein